MNYIPTSPIQQSQLHFLIEAANTDLQKSNGSFSQEHRIQLKKASELQSSLLSPIRTLPPEIMSMIFKLVAGDTVILSSRSKRANSIFPLTWVCTWWREIILSQPSFWSALDVDLGVVNDDFEMTKAMLWECIIRSRATSPMRLRVVSSVRQESPGLNAVLDTLAEHAGRWQSLNVYLSTSTHLQRMLEYVDSQNISLTGSHFPLLEVLDLTFLPPIPAGFFGTSFIRCPRLHTLCIAHLRDSDAIDLMHLTTLSISRYSGRSFAILLEKCPVLQSLTVTHASTQLDEAISHIPYVSHTHLTNLKLNSMNQKLLPTGIWESVRFPNLIHLQIGFGDTRPMDAMNTFDELKTMLIQSQCVLQSVRLDGNVSLNHVDSLFRGIPVSSETNSRIVNGNPYHLSQ